MKSLYRHKLAYYKQTYNFCYNISNMTHPSWLEGIFIPPKIKGDAQKSSFFLTQHLMSKVTDSVKTDAQSFDISLYMASLPNGKWTRFLNYLTLCFLKNDKLLLRNGEKLKKLQTFLAPHEMEFLIFDKEIKIPIYQKIPSNFNFELELENFHHMSYFLLKIFFNRESPNIFQYLQFRFNKNIENNEVLNSEILNEIVVPKELMQQLVYKIFPEDQSIFAQ